MNIRTISVACLWVALSSVLCAVSALAGYAEGSAAYERGDYATALHEFTEAAEEGDALAQHSLGVMYDEGQGVPQDYTTALGWYRKAAEQGLARAQLRYGSMYHEGKGVARDYARAVEWYRRAAGQGFEPAHGMLGVMYETGKGVPQDYVKAYAWYSISAAQGDDGSSARRDAVARRMTLTQVEAAQLLSREYFEKYVAPFRASD